MKRSEQKTKLSYLTTSPQKFQQGHGNGYSNMVSQFPTGKPIAAILKKTNDSSSKLENRWTSLSAAAWPFPTNLDGSGGPMETATDEAISMEMLDLQKQLSAWKMSYLPTKSGKQDT